MGIGVAFTGFSQTPLYTQGFEAGLAGWTINNGANGTWDIGTPANTIINSAANGVNSVATNLTGDYNVNDNSTVTSPLINITAATGKEFLSMSVFWNSENSWDGANIFGSYDGGTTWAIIGAFNDPNNWYNDNTIGGNPQGSGDGWTGNGSGGWVTAKHTLDSADLVDNTSLMLRVGFGSDGIIVQEGFAFDDIFVGAPIRVDLSATVVGVPAQCSFGTLEPITVTVCNIGDTTYNIGTLIPVSYSIDGGTAITENIILVAPFTTNDCVNYTFATLANLSVPGAHDIKSWTSYAGDIQFPNDTTITNLYNSTAAIPYFANFESGQEGWTIDNGASGSFDYGTPAGVVIDSAASGTSAFVTNLTGNYNNNEASSVTSACIDITAATGNEVVVMKVWWDTQNSWDGANLFASYDNGATWNQVGNDNDPNNWYNDNTINGNPQGSGEGWTGDGNNGSAGWVVAQHRLDSAMMVDSTSLLLRVGFGSSFFTPQEGFAFDDVAIGLPTAATYEYGVAGVDSVLGICDPTYTLDAGPGQLFYHISDLANNFNSTWSNEQTLTVSNTGLYVITVTNAMGMMATDTVYVEIQDFDPPVLVDVVDCTPGAIGLFNAGSGTIPGNITYLWSTGDLTQASSLGSIGTIWVTKTDAILGCSASDTAIFTDEPIFTLGNDTSLCAETTFDLNPGSAISYLWNDGTSNPTLTVGTAGLFYVTIVDGNGCAGSDSLTITAIHTLPIVDLGQDDFFCTGVHPSLPFDAGTAVSYLWNDGSTNQTFTPPVSGSYNVTITDVNGCMGSDTILVIVDACVGVDELASDTEIKMYPNPTQGGLTIEFAAFNNDVVMNVLNIYGQVVRTGKLTSVTTVLDLNDLSEGTYILQLQSEDSITVNKFVINR